VKTTYVPLILAGLVLVACSDEATAPTVEPDLNLGAVRTDAITVLTRNAYIGADVDAVIAALMSEDPNDDMAALQTAITTLGATDLPTRARGFAREIARTRPDVVGFQEITQLNIHLGPLGLPVDIDLDFLPTIQAALAARGLDYAVGGQVKNIDVTLLGGLIHMVDYDAVLYNPKRVQWQTLIAKNFEYNLGPIAEGVVLQRGYVAGTATVGDVTYTIVSTHPESDLGTLSMGDLRAGQMTEIAEVLNGVDHAIVMGDLNDEPGSAMYQVLTGAGFSDTWAELHPRLPGDTCCNLPDLSNRQAGFDHRIDYVFARGFDLDRRGLTSWVTLVGDHWTDRLRGPVYPIWPSDHAGVAAKLLVSSPPPVKKHR
jgi:Endonuclease/Exonuclease/phosphatase family